MTIFNIKAYEDLSAGILEKIKKQGATSGEVAITIDAGFSVSSRLGKVETIEHHQDKGIAITVFFGQQAGTTSSSDLSPAAIETAIQKACSIASYTSLDPYAGIADKPFMAFDYPNLALDYPWEISTKTALDFAIECENLAMRDSRITNSEGVTVTNHRSLHLYANTHDFTGSYLVTQHGFHCILIAQGKDQMHRDYEYSIARDPADLQKIEDLAMAVQKKTISRLNPRRLKTRMAPVIFSADIARSLLGNFVNAINGNNIYRNASFLVNQLNTPVFPTHISLTQYPHLLKAMGSMPFDNEGVRTLEQNFVKEGILTNYILDSYSARKLGLKTTGNAGGVYNLLATTSDLSFKELLQKMDTGLLVTELIGQGVNIVNGDYSRGAFGFWVEKGEIQYPVEEITISGNLRDMFKNIVAIANDVDTRGRIQTGSILLDGLMIAGE
jgi:PmbA protein